MTRLSIAKIMGVIGLMGLILAALRSASAGWVILVQLITLTFLLSAILGIVLGRGARRAGWIGFVAFVCGIHLSHHVPSLACLGMDGVTMWVLNSLPDKVFARKWTSDDAFFVRQTDSDHLVIAKILDDPQNRNFRVYWQEGDSSVEMLRSSFNATEVHRLAIHQIISPLIMLWFGFLGALIGRSFYSARSIPSPARPGE